MSIHNYNLFLLILICMWYKLQYFHVLIHASVYMYGRDSKAGDVRVCVRAFSSCKIDRQAVMFPFPVVSLSDPQPFVLIHSVRIVISTFSISLFFRVSLLFRRFATSVDCYHPPPLGSSSLCQIFTVIWTFVSGV